MNITSTNKMYSNIVAFLFEGSYKAIPFNIILALLLAIDLYHNKVPTAVIGLWFFCISAISIVRWVACLLYKKKKILTERLQMSLYLFILATFVNGAIWSSVYFLSLPYIKELHEFIIILVFGGMCAGSIASLSIYLPAYYAYITPMLIPILIYNFSFMNFDRGLIGLMILLFIIMVGVTASLTRDLLNTTIRISLEKESLIKQLKKMTVTDSLTGLYNRRYFEEILSIEFYKGKRNKMPLSLVLIDVDNFKMVNDALGHPVGDILLIRIADFLKETLKRSNDIVFRLGGDEFAVILLNSKPEDTLAICENIKANFKKCLRSDGMEGADLTSFSNVSLSMGIIHIQPESQLPLDQIVLTVDKALYKAKHMGKNQVIVDNLSS